MQINGVSSQIPSTIQTKMTPQTTPAVEEAYQEQPQSSEIPEPEVVEQEGNDSGKVKGVVRNLLDGHFKGVADVRLRINHFEELAAIEGEQLKAIAEEKVAGVLDAVGSVVDNILISSELLTAEAASEDEMGTVLELHTDFVDTVNQLKEQFQSALAPSTDNLIGGIENAFAAFVESLQNLLVPIMEEDSTIDEVGPESESVGGDGGDQVNEVAVEAQTAEEQEDQISQITVTTTTETEKSILVETEQLVGEGPIVGEPPPTEGYESIVSEQESLVVETPAADGPQLPIPTGSTYQDLIDEMDSAFTGAIAELTEALNTAQVIPEVSGPNGNGKAYDKFLAIYHNL